MKIEEKLDLIVRPAIRAVSGHDDAPIEVVRAALTGLRDEIDGLIQSLPKDREARAAARGKLEAERAVAREAAMAADRGRAQEAARAGKRARG